MDWICECGAEGTVKIDDPVCATCYGKWVAVRLWNEVDRDFGLFFASLVTELNNLGLPVEI